MKVKVIEIRPDGAQDAVYVKANSAVITDEPMRGFGVAIKNYTEDCNMLVSIHFIKQKKRK